MILTVCTTIYVSENNNAHVHKCPHLCKFPHLGLLADLFNLVGLSTLHLNTMRLLLKLNNGLREAAVDHVSGNA
jgi:hypothetical protein